MKSDLNTDLVQNLDRLNQLAERQAIQYWLIQLGKFFYAGGLRRKSSIEDIVSYEFVSNELVAFPFFHEGVANSIAEQCGGSVVIRNAPGYEYIALRERNDKYIKSEKEWFEELERQFKSILINEDTALE